MDQPQTPEDVLLIQEPRESPVRQYAAKWNRAWEEIQERVRQEPGRHILGALAVGYILSVIPFRSLLIPLIRICFILVRPALLLLGVVKLAEYLRKSE
jgi:hypothetical protein